MSRHLISKQDKKSIDTKASGHLSHSVMSVRSFWSVRSVRSVWSVKCDMTNLHRSILEILLDLIKNYKKQMRMQKRSCGIVSLYQITAEIHKLSFGRKQMVLVQLTVS